MIKLVTIPSDDFLDPVSGQYAHLGEWVKVWPTMNIAALRRFQAALKTLETLDSGMEGPELVLTLSDLITPVLAERLAEWNWTGRSQALPQLDGTTAPFEECTYAELMYLFKLQTGETETERKNASAPSPTGPSTVRASRQRK